MAVGGGAGDSEAGGGFFDREAGEVAELHDRGGFGVFDCQPGECLVEGEQVFRRLGRVRGGRRSARPPLAPGRRAYHAACDEALFATRM